MNTLLDLSLILGWTLLFFSGGIIIGAEYERDKDIFYDENTIGFYIYDTKLKNVRSIPYTVENHVGDWIAIDISDMEDMEMAVEVCSHEVAHHIYRNSDLWVRPQDEADENFAEYCEENITKCLDLWEGRK